jgi:hypothetical protein
MGYTDQDWQSINTIRTLAVSLSPENDPAVVIRIVIGCCAPQHCAAINDANLKTVMARIIMSMTDS